MNRTHPSRILALARQTVTWLAVWAMLTVQIGSAKATSGPIFWPQEHVQQNSVKKQKDCRGLAASAGTRASGDSVGAEGGALGGALGELYDSTITGQSTPFQQDVSQLIGGLASLAVGDASMAGATAALNGLLYNHDQHYWTDLTLSTPWGLDNILSKHGYDNSLGKSTFLPSFSDPDELDALANYADQNGQEVARDDGKNGYVLIVNYPEPVGYDTTTGQLTNRYVVYTTPYTVFPTPFGSIGTRFITTMFPRASGY